MENTARIPGKNGIKTFIKAATSKSASQILQLLNIQDTVGYERANKLAEDLFEIIGDDVHHDLNTFMDLLTEAIERYEKNCFPIKRSSPIEVLRFLMESHQLSQTDLAKELGGQSVVSDILKGKRDLNLRQVKVLSQRFNMNPAIFLT